MASQMELKLKALYNGMMDTMKICFALLITFLKEMEEHIYRVFDQH